MSYSINFRDSVPSRTPVNILEWAMDPYVEPPNNDSVMSIAKRCLYEYSVAIACAVLCSSFVEGPEDIKTLLIGLNIQIMVGIIFRMGEAYFGSKAKEKQGILGKATYGPACLLCQHLGAASFAIGSGSDMITLTHEMGHAITFKGLYKNSHPKITLYPYGGGVTYPSLTNGVELTWVGEMMDSSSRDAVVSASGTFFQLAFSIFLLRQALINQKKYPEVSRILSMISNYSTLISISYAYSALDPQASKILPGHDFAKLQQVGIPPTIAIIIVLALPILTYLTYSNPRGAFASLFLPLTNVDFVSLNRFKRKSGVVIEELPPEEGEILRSGKERQVFAADSSPNPSPNDREVELLIQEV